MSPSRRALLLPGRAYPTTMPLLDMTGRVLADHGWPVSAVSWEFPGDVDDVRRWVADHAAPVVALNPADRWLFAAKSMGTQIVHATDLRADAYVLLTPLVADPEAVAAIAALVDDGVPVLLVGGTGDQFWSTEGALATGAEVFEVPDADHAMAIDGDPARTAEILTEVGRAVDAFVGALGG